MSATSGGKPAGAVNTVSGPLSLVKMTSVSFATPLRDSASNTSPTLQSVWLTNSP